MNEIVSGLLAVMCCGLLISCYKLLVYNAEYRQEFEREKNEHRREYEKVGRLETELREATKRNDDLDKKLTKITAIVTGVPAEQGFDSGYGLLDPSPDVQAFHSVCRVHNHRWGDADARLIAAAPDLLAACQRAYECCYDKNSEDGMALKAAISKATKQ